MANDMNERGHRLFQYNFRSNWSVIEDDSEIPITREETRMIHYIFEFLDWEGIKRRFIEAQGKNLLYESRNKQFELLSARILPKKETRRISRIQLHNRRRKTTPFRTSHVHVPIRVHELETSARIRKGGTKKITKNQFSFTNQTAAFSFSLLPVFIFFLLYG